MRAHELLTENPDWFVPDREGNIDVPEEASSLIGAPDVVQGSFDCGSTQITSLRGAPELVHGDFDCYNTQITSLEGGPREVHSDFNCNNCKDLVSLRGAPEIVGAFYCFYVKITSLEGIPRVVRGWLDCSGCKKLVSLHGAPQEVHGNFNCWGSGITDPYEYRYALTCKIIDGIFNSKNNEVDEIINAHHWGHGDKKLVMHGMKLLKELNK